MSETKIFDIINENNVIIINIKSDSSIDSDLNILGEVSSIKKEIQTETPRGVIFNFAETTYFGSSMLEAILEIWNQTKETNCKLIICELSKIGQEILELSKLDTLWEIKKTQEEAIESIQ